MSRLEIPVTAYIDGSCDNSKGVGGIGVYLSWGTYQKKISKGYECTTSSRMEIQSLLTALQRVDKKYTVEIFSDSQYVVFAIKKRWLWQWDKSSFSGKKNSDLWKMVLKEYNKFPKGHIKIDWIRGHALTPGNIEADRLAREGFYSVRDNVK